MISAALELVGESAAADVTLRAVARRAGVSAAAPYHHFSDKDALLAAVARDGFEALSQVQFDVLGGSGSAQQRLELLVERYVLFAVNHRSHYDVMFRTLPTEVAGAEGDALHKAALAAFGRLVEAIQAANPALSADDATRRGVVAWAMAHGAVDVSRWGQALRSGLDAEALAGDVGRAAGRLALDR